MASGAARKGARMGTTGAAWASAREPPPIVATRKRKKAKKRDDDDDDERVECATCGAAEPCGGGWRERGDDGGWIDEARGGVGALASARRAGILLGVIGLLRLLRDSSMGHLNA